MMFMNSPQKSPDIDVPEPPDPKEMTDESNLHQKNGEGVDLLSEFPYSAQYSVSEFIGIINNRYSNNDNRNATWFNKPFFEEMRALVTPMSQGKEKSKALENLEILRKNMFENIRFGSQFDEALELTMMPIDGVKKWPAVHQLFDNFHNLRHEGTGTRFDRMVDLLEQSMEEEQSQHTAIKACQNLRELRPPDRSGARFDRIQNLVERMPGGLEKNIAFTMLSLAFGDLLEGDRNAMRLQRTKTMVETMQSETQHSSEQALKYGMPTTQPLRQFALSVLEQYSKKEKKKSLKYSRLLGR